MKKHILTLTLLICFTTLLTGCFEQRLNTEQLCVDNPDLKCEELNLDDGQCRIPRTNLIWHRLAVQRNPTDINKIREYHQTQTYQTCLEVAAGIIPIDQPGLKQNRFEALVNAGKNLERLVDELENYHTPEALYFLWSEQNDKNARREFLQLEPTNKLDTARLQYALATFYIDHDLNKTVVLLNRALEFSTDPKELNLDIIKSLASVHQLLNNKSRSYIWTMVAKSFNVPVVTERELNLLFDFTDEEYEKLDDIADDVTRAIKKGAYKRNLIPDYL